MLFLGSARCALEIPVTLFSALGLLLINSAVPVPPPSLFPEAEFLWRVGLIPLSLTVLPSSLPSGFKFFYSQDYWFSWCVSLPHHLLSFFLFFVSFLLILLFSNYCQIIKNIISEFSQNRKCHDIPLLTLSIHFIFSSYVFIMIIVFLLSQVLLCSLKQMLFVFELFFLSAWITGIHHHTEQNLNFQEWEGIPLFSAEWEQAIANRWQGWANELCHGFQG